MYTLLYWSFLCNMFCFNFAREVFKDTVWTHSSQKNVKLYFNSMHSSRNLMSFENWTRNLPLYLTHHHKVTCNSTKPPKVPEIFPAITVWTRLLLLNTYILLGHYSVRRFSTVHSVLFLNLMIFLSNLLYSICKLEKWDWLWLY